MQKKKKSSLKYSGAFFHSRSKYDQLIYIEFQPLTKSDLKKSKYYIYTTAPTSVMSWFIFLKE